MMKLKYKNLIMAVASLAIIGCQPDEHDLGGEAFSKGDLVQGISHSITVDENNPNTFHLKSLLDSEYNPVWLLPTGEIVQKKDVTVNIAFADTSYVTFGVQTKAGVVFGDADMLVTEQFCADFVSGEMWENLTGGVGESKTWVPDNGKYGMKQGFYSCFEPSATYVDMTHSDDAPYNWYPDGKVWWEPSNADAGVTDDDLGSYMTFSLQGMAGIKVHRVNGGVETVTNGQFVFDQNSMVMSATGADFIHGAWADGKAVDFRNGFQVLVLTENQLMIANYRDPVLSGEGRCIYCWNFVSKEYADNYKAEEIVDFTLEGKYAGDAEGKDQWKKYINGVSSMKMSDESPFDYFTLTGERINSYAGSSSYPMDITPKEKVSNIDFTFGGNGAAVFHDIDAIRYSCKYSITDDGYYDFGSSDMPEVLIGGELVKFKTDADNRLRILDYTTTMDGMVSDIWLGVKQYDAFGNAINYLAYHFVTGFIEPGFDVQLDLYDSKANVFGICSTNGSGSLFLLDNGDCEFTVKYEGAEIAAFDGWYVDVYKLLAVHPSATMKLVSVKVNGVDKTSDIDAPMNISSVQGDLATTGRLLLCNAWGASCITDFSTWTNITSMEVTISLKLNE